MHAVLQQVEGSRLYVPVYVGSFPEAHEIGRQAAQDGLTVHVRPANRALWAEYRHRVGLWRQFGLNGGL